MKPKVACTVHLFLFISIWCYSLVVTGQKRILPKKQVKRISKVPVYQDYDLLNCRRWESAAEFPTCDTGWIRYLVKTIDLDLPKRNGAPPGAYTTEVWFVILKDGSIEAVQATTHSGFGMEEELIRAIRQSPQWRAATQNGRKVSYRIKQQFRYVVKEPVMS